MVIPGEKYRPAGGGQISEKCDGGHILRTIVAAKMCGVGSSKAQRSAAGAVGDLHVKSKRVKAGLPVVRATLASGLILAVLTAAASAGPFEDAAVAYRQGDYTRALRIIRPMARKGYAPAQFNLGLIYVKGNGVPQDYREALKWYRKAADQGNAAAQRNLGVMLGEGLGVPQDYAVALKWFRRAAEQSDAAAQTNLGVMYDFGHGVVRDYAEALKWYRKAADHGDAEARYNLGVIYERGDDVPQNCQSAPNRDPGSASKRDPTFLRFERLALAPSELVGVAETARARVGA